LTSFFVAVLGGQVNVDDSASFTIAVCTFERMISTAHLFGQCPQWIDTAYRPVGGISVRYLGLSPKRRPFADGQHRQYSVS
jgi:hypothetical protein